MITTDFVPITPLKNQESIHIAIGESITRCQYKPLIRKHSGQRYSVIVEANASAQADGNYWIRTISSQGCGAIQNNTATTGIIRYDAGSTVAPTSAQYKDLDTTCHDPPLESLVPIVPWIVDQQP